MNKRAKTVAFITIGGALCAGVLVGAKAFFSVNEGAAAVVVDGSKKEVSRLEIVTDGDIFEFIAELPQTDYLAGVLAVYENGSQEPIFPSDAAWSSSNEDIFIVLGNGAIIPVAPGTAAISVSYGGATAKKNIVIKRGVISSVEFEPKELTIIKLGGADSEDYSRSFSVVARTSSGAIFDITDNPALKIEKGNAEITAQIGEVNATLPLTVIDADSVVGLRLIQGGLDAALGVGYSSAIGVYAICKDSDDMIDITSKVSWNVDSPEKLELISGNITGLKEGRVKVTATFLDKSGDITIDVKEIDQHTDAIPFP